MIIGLTGKKQSGKSTAAKYLEEKYDAIRVNFKDALVAEIIERFPDLLQEYIIELDNTQYDGMNPWTITRLFEEKPGIVRRLLQNYGTNVRRQDEADYWVRKWRRTINEIPMSKIVVVDDARFINESNAIKSEEGIVIRIIREDLVSTDTHVSELEMDQIIPNYTISVKTGEQELLYKELDRIILSL